MVRPIERWEIEGREEAQKNDIRRRTEFLTLNGETQQEILSVMKKADTLLLTGDLKKAQELTLSRITRHLKPGFKNRKKNVDWDSVEEQIKDSCFSDGEMTGLTLVPKRVANERVILKSLLEDLD